MAVLPDLVSYSDALTMLDESLPTDGSALQVVVHAASDLVRAYCRRDFTTWTYDELQSGRGYSAIRLNQYPVLSVARVSLNPVDALTISNQDGVSSRATASMATTGDLTTGIVPVGIDVMRQTNGVTVVNEGGTSILFSANPTLQALAAAINALGHGWTAVAAPPYGPWSSSELRPIQGAQGAMGTHGASFQVFAEDASGWSIKQETGELRFNLQGFDPIFALMGVGWSGSTSNFYPGFQNIRVVYTAGYATIPGPVCQAVMMTIQALAHSMVTSPQYQQERAGEWSYTLSAPIERAIPTAAKCLLTPYISKRFLN